MSIKNEFLEKLAVLCEDYSAEFTYTTDDNGIEIYIFGDLVFRGWMSADTTARLLRQSMT